jgi:hypothetical protein
MQKRRIHEIENKPQKRKNQLKIILRNITNVKKRKENYKHKEYFKHKDIKKRQEY